MLVVDISDIWDTMESIPAVEWYLSIDLLMYNRLYKEWVKVKHNYIIIIIIIIIIIM